MMKIEFVVWRPLSTGGFFFASHRKLSSFFDGRENLAQRSYLTSLLFYTKNVERDVCNHNEATKADGGAVPTRSRRYGNTKGQKRSKVRE
jgi:hypothetical protein